MKIQSWLIAAMGLFAATSLRGETSTDAGWHELEAFIVEESALAASGDLSPLSMPVRSFGAGLGVDEVPRSISVLTRELQALLGIDSYDVLDRFGAGTQRINYFGLAGSAFLRGTRAGTYFNGMLRAYQRNEMPTSFGSLEGLELIKGPVPAAFSPTLVGGGVNQLPKAPYFERAHGSVELGAGSWDEYFLQLDYGAPVQLGRYPAAYRLSYTGQRAERFYDDVPNDYDSLYAAIKLRLSARQRLFAGAELYDYRSSEIPGINRPTAELIRDRSYVIGEPPRLTSAQWGGAVVRPLVEFPFSLTVNPALFALAVPGDIARQQIPPQLLARMADLSDSATLDSLYTVLPETEVPPFARDARAFAAELLGQVDVAPQDAFLYTPAYFAAGGEVLTTRLDSSKVLADPADRANARNAIAFADLETELGPDRTMLLRFFAEHLDSDKASTYGFAFRSRQWIANLRAEYQMRFNDGRSFIHIGADLRYSHARALQDFDAEPFARRDLSSADISANTLVAAGAAVSPVDGLNFWSTFGTASEQSELLQAGLYAGGAIALRPALMLHYGARIEQGSWSSGLPGAVQRASAVQRADRRTSGNVILYNLHLNPHLRLAKGLYAYTAVQFSRAVAPGDGGTISSRNNFTDAELFETGLKWAFADGRGFMSVSLYHWDQAAFSSRDAIAQPLRAKGLEWEASIPFGQRLTLIGAFTAQRVHLRGDLLGFGALPRSQQDWALTAGVLTAAGDRAAPLNPDLVYAGLPEVSASLYAVLDLPGGWQLSAGPLWRDAFFHDMQRSLRIPAHVIWHARVRYDTTRWWAELRVDNLFDTAYWIGQEPVFSAGTLILQGQARRLSARLGLRF